MSYPALLDRFVVVLVEPQLGVNLGTVVRAMKNMGLTRLRLVAPGERLDLEEVQRSAHRTLDIVEAMTVHDTLEAALANCHRAVGLTARSRTRSWPTGTPRGRAPALLERARAGQQIALVFGREERGLTNEELERCDEFVTIPTRTDYASLNLAQAVLLVSHELFLAASDEATVLGEAQPARTIAPKADRIRLLAQAIHTLDATGFFKSKARAGVEHTLARIISRAQLDVRETRMLTGVFVEVLKFAERVRRGIIPAELPEATVRELDPDLERLLDED